MGSTDGADNQVRLHDASGVAALDGNCHPAVQAEQVSGCFFAAVSSQTCLFVPILCNGNLFALVLTVQSKHVCVRTVVTNITKLYST